MPIVEAELEKELHYLKMKKQDLIRDMQAIDPLIDIYQEIRERVDTIPLTDEELPPGSEAEIKTKGRPTKIVKSKPFDTLTSEEMTDDRREYIYSKCKSKYVEIKTKLGPATGID